MKILKFILPLFITILILSGCSNVEVYKLNEKAVQLMNNGDVDGAIARLVSINDLNPNFPQAYYNLGVAYDYKKEYQKSVDAFNCALTLKPKFAEAFYGLGVVYEKMAYEEIEKITEDDAVNEDPKKLQQKLNENQEVITDYLNKSIKAFEGYLDVEPTTKDRPVVESRLENLNNQIKEYTIK